MCRDMMWRSLAPMALAPSIKFACLRDMTCDRAILTPWVLPSMPMRSPTVNIPGVKKRVSTRISGKSGIVMKMSIARIDDLVQEPPVIPGKHPDTGTEGARD